MVKPIKTFSEIVGENEETIIKVLRGWQKLKERLSWSDYASGNGTKSNPGIGLDVRDMLETVFREMRQNGYFNPRVTGDGKLIHDVLVFKRGREKDEQLDACDLCVEECSIKDRRGVFKVDERNRTVGRCWQK
jgi:hypothetical protein